MNSGIVFLSAFYAAVGPVIGSHVACVIDRTELGWSVTSDRSRCFACLRALRWFELFPIFSHIAQAGRCRQCRAAIPPHLLKIEASFLVATLAVVLLSAPETLSFSVIFVWLLISLAVFDARLGRLPHLLTYSLAAIGLLAAVTYSLPALNAALLGVAVGAIAAIVTATVYKAFAGRDGLGGGDIRMIAATGAWLGWEGLPSAIFVASATAILFVLWTRKPSRSMRIAFGPFIALGALIVRAWQMAY